MTLLEIVFLGVGLSMDAAAITAANTLAYDSSPISKKWLMPVSFAVFQGIMPVLGRLIGSLISDFISRYSGIVMFLIFGVIGVKMIWDSFKKDGGETEGAPAELGLGLITVQAVATSVDAFAVGVGFAASDVNTLYASAVIAATTFVICAVSLILGTRFAKFLANKASLVGGGILLVIAAAALV